MNKIKDIVLAGFLKENEEIYFDYGDYHFTARIVGKGEFIETKLGKFKSPSPAAGTLLALIDNGELVRYPKTDKRLEEVVCNGWNRWTNWNGKTLDELRKKLSND